MRAVSTLVALLLAATTLPASVTFERVWPGYRTADSFVRLAEYFGAAETPVTDSILRSDPAERAGHYWLVRTAATTPTTAATFELTVVLPGQAEATRHAFPLDLPTGQHVTLLGLTGPDWPAATTRPAAWHLALRSASGDLLAAESSFLWRDPPVD